MLDINKLNQHRKKTEDDLDNMLREKRNICVTRPCGYGKSYLIIKECKKKKGKKLILEPTYALIDHLKLKYSQELTQDITVNTYGSSLRKTAEDFKKIYGNLDYIFADECHRSGAEKWGEGLLILKQAFPNAQLIGFSATPERMDGNNVVNTVFEGNEVEPLYLADAILQDLLPNPCYVASLYAIDEFVQARIVAVNNSNLIGKEEKPLLIDEIQNHMINYKKLYNIPNILQKYILLNAEYKHNMKFIVFVRNVEEIEETKQLAIKWFSEAFSHMQKIIKIYDVNYQKGREENQKITEEFETSTGNDVIDIMIAVNMFNEGIHLDNITGVVLLRKTASDIIYLQQLGRTIDATGKTPIIFDFVNNYKYLGDGYISLLNNSHKKYNYGKTNDGRLKTSSGDIINIHDDGKDILDILQSYTKITNYYGDEEIKLLNSFNGELTINELSEKTGFPSRTIQYLCHKNQIPYKRMWRFIPKGLEFFTQTQRTDIANFLKTYEGKLSKKELSQETGYGEDIIDFFTSSWYNVPYNIEKTKIEECENQELKDEHKQFIDKNVFVLTAEECANYLKKPIEVVRVYYKQSKYNQTPHRAKVTDEIKQYIYDNASTQTYSELSANTGLSYITVVNTCKGMGIIAKKNDRKESAQKAANNHLNRLKEDIDSINFINNNKNNITLTALTRQIPYGKKTIQKYLDEMGIKLQSKEKKQVPEKVIKSLQKNKQNKIKEEKKIKKKTKKEIIKEYVELHPEKTQKEFVEELNVDWGYLSTIIREYNLEYKIDENRKTKKLSKKDREDIRNIYIPNDSEYGRIALAKKYNVCTNTITNIVKGINKDKKKIHNPWDDFPFGKITYEAFVKYQETIINEYNKGTTNNEIKKMCNNMGNKVFWQIIKYLKTNNIIQDKQKGYEQLNINNTLLVDEFKSGKSLCVLAKEYGTSEATIRRRLLKEISEDEYKNIQQQNKRSVDNEKYNFCDEVIDLILKFKQKGLSTHKIANQMGIRHQKLGELLREMGYQNDTCFTVCEEIFSIIMKFKDSGKTYMEIAKLTGLHPKRVEYIIKTNNK